MVQIGPKWSYMVQSCPKSSKIVQNHSTLSKMVQNGFLPLLPRWVRHNQVPCSSLLLVILSVHIRDSVSSECVFPLLAPCFKNNQDECHKWHSIASKPFLGTIFFISQTKFSIKCHTLHFSMAGGYKVFIYYGNFISTTFQISRKCPI